jgi:hypothetical protein
LSYFKENKEKLEDTKGVISILKSKKDRLYNDQKKKGKRTNNDLQNITEKIKDQATRTPLKTAGELGCSGRRITHHLYIYKSKNTTSVLK